MNSNYAVIFTYSFDSEVSVYLFKTEDEAKKFLLDSLKEEVRIDIEDTPKSQIILMMETAQLI